MNLGYNRSKSAILTLRLGLVVLLGSASLGAENLVFSGTIRFGTTTPVGSGGRIIKVTTLESKGAGSLRAAISAEGPRIVVFEVGGVIDLQGQNLRIDSPFLTIAGQTAPSPGITLIRGGLTVSNTHDVLIQHLAVRPGDNGRSKGSGWDTDAIAVSASRRVVVDHCSTTWAVDENLSVSGPRLQGTTSSDVTFSNCLIAEGLNDASHAKGPHSKGTLIHDRIQRVAIIGCLYASNVDRNPYFKIGSSGVVANRVIFNPGEHAITAGWRPVEWEGRQAPPEPELSILGNVLIHGLDTPENLSFISAPPTELENSSDHPSLENSPGSQLPEIGRFYLQGNWQVMRDGSQKRPNVPAARLRPHPILWLDGLKVSEPEETLASVLRNAGARPFDRDPIDQRIVDGVRQGTGRLIDSQSEVGGYPNYAPTYRKLEIPTQDIDAWLASFAPSPK
ncbi:hypothetical protein [Pelagicoccus sp. SDUM812005]|uniref:pectate lyase family protein n=1 Tax=Pelagicoccus sp. SDUM812005 TaxID=3041257 RepID=UPI00280C7CDF|nr:hypothetical protein [Pelagicoccus sp. SDUM812005]MDQ8180709.1 hypothetical protein [Pelagicoccus sp. SDUM812005]